MGSQPPTSGKERDWASSLATAAPPRLGWTCQVLAGEYGPAGLVGSIPDPVALQPQRGPISLVIGWGTESGAEAIQPGPEDSPAQGPDLASLNSGTVLGPQARRMRAFGISDERRSKL